MATSNQFIGVPCTRIGTNGPATITVSTYPRLHQYRRMRETFGCPPNYGTGGSANRICWPTLYPSVKK